MHVSTTQVLRKFAQKMAGQTKQANPLTALADPRVLGSLGGAAVGGLGAYGLSRLTQSEEDKETSNTPMLAGLLGALAGGAGGYYGAPHLAAMLRKTPAVTPVDGLRKDLTGHASYNDVVANAKTQNPFPAPKNVTPLSAGPKRISTPAQSAKELSEAVGYEGGEPDHIATSPNFNRGYNRPNISGVDAEEPG